ncbi:MAG: N-acetyltransferase [Myxococcales bacterium]|nr:N-acetyltransferase [Myxococcales bacterium]
MTALPTRSELMSGAIATARTVLAPLGVPDADEVLPVVDASRAWLEPWLPWVPYQQDIESARRFAEASELDWDHGRALRFTIRERASGSLLGVVGLEACVAMHRSCALGYWLKKDAAGRGLMTEAAGACLEFAFRVGRFHRVRVAAATDNHASLRVIARLGFRFEGVERQAEFCHGRWLDHATFGMLEHEWIRP